MHNLEIERKFLVTDDSYKQLSVCRYDIVQGYICKEAGRTVRVRIRTEKSLAGGASAVQAFLTIKSKPAGDGLARFEWEREIDASDAKQLLQMCLPGLLEKTRWIVPCADSSLKWEVDEFHGRKEGLVMAEIELEHEDQTFIKPSFIGNEVTGNPHYYNANM